MGTRMHPDHFLEEDTRVLAFIRAYYARQDCTPTLREIGRACDIASTDHVSRIVRRLAANGTIVIQPRRYRGIQLVER